MSVAQMPVITTPSELSLPAAPIPSDWIASGSPTASASVVATSDDGFLTTSVWECTPGSFTWHYPGDETIYVIEGEAVLTGQDGWTKRLTPGDSASFKPGMSVDWEVREKLRKVSVLHRPMPAPWAKSLRLVSSVRAKLRGAVSRGGADRRAGRSQA